MYFHIIFGRVTTHDIKTTYAETIHSLQITSNETFDIQFNGAEIMEYEEANVNIPCMIS